jgi:DNA-binding GntR family transcriptional regulator
MGISDIGDRASAGDIGYARIRGDIIFGRLKPGQRLRLETLKQTYGLSITTIREILNHLTADRLVLAENNRGFEVAPVSVEDLKGLAELRLVLECHAIERSFAQGDVEWEARVTAAHHKLASTEHLMAADIGLIEQWKQYDSEFHQALISSCGSSPLMETHAAVFDRYFRYQMLTFKFREEEPARQHLELLRFAIARDAKRAKGVLRVHVNDCLEHAIAQWPVE